MSTSNFEVREHVIDTQHIREYARATANSQEDVLHLAIKQYIPLSNLNPTDGDVTIIGAHANGFPKEMYEPLWDELLSLASRHGFKIRSIWISDFSCQGASGVLNEHLLGNDPSWLDHSRDLLHMVNHFRSQMPLPIIGLGHSFGGASLVNLSLMHPRLLSTLILLDPVIQDFSSAHDRNPVRLSTFRRDLWPSREEAESSMRKAKAFQTWDPRVLDQWFKYGLRETPTALFPDDKHGVTLTTTKHHECFTFVRPSWEGLSPDGKSIVNLDMIPDIRLDAQGILPVYRPEPTSTVHKLPELRPSVLYIFGGKSDMSAPHHRAKKMKLTGVGFGGSGGVKAGRVEERVLEEQGHLVAMEAPKKCAEFAADWVGREMVRIRRDREAYMEWTKKTVAEKTTLSDEWKKQIGGPIQRPPKGKL